MAAILFSQEEVYCGAAEPANRQIAAARAGASGGMRRSPSLASKAGDSSCALRIFVPFRSDQNIALIQMMAMILCRFEKSKCTSGVGKCMRREWRCWEAKVACFPTAPFPSQTDAY